MDIVAFLHCVLWQLRQFAMDWMSVTSVVQHPLYS